IRRHQEDPVADDLEVGPGTLQLPLPRGGRDALHHLAPRWHGVRSWGHLSVVLRVHDFFFGRLKARPTPGADDVAILRRRQLQEDETASRAQNPQHANNSCKKSAVGSLQSPVTSPPTLRFPGLLTADRRLARRPKRKGWGLFSPSRSVTNCAPSLLLPLGCAPTSASHAATRCQST